jgi:predicted metallo-beta-lactamase superfamily hydrolase
VGPQDPKDVTRDTVRDLSGVVKELAAPNGDAHHWLRDPEYAALRLRLENAHAAAEAALVEAQGAAERGTGSIASSFTWSSASRSASI